VLQNTKKKQKKNKAAPYHLPGNVIHVSAAVGLVYMKLPNSTHFKQFQKLVKIRVGGTVPSHPKEKNSAVGSEFLFIATCASDLTFLAPLTSEI